MAGEAALREHVVQSAKVAKELIVVGQENMAMFTLTDYNLNSSEGTDVQTNKLYRLDRRND